MEEDLTLHFLALDLIPVSMTRQIIRLFKANRYYLGSSDYVDRAKCFWFTLPLGIELAEYILKRHLVVSPRIHILLQYDIWYGLHECVARMKAVKVLCYTSVINLVL